MPVAEIIAIGTELLLGEIQDTNTRYLARSLRDAGINLYRTMVVGDNPQRIAQAIQEAMQRADIIITTGGLGPTVDDPTRQAVALAVGVQIEFRPELWEQIQTRFQRYGRAATDNNRRQAYIPAGAIAVENPVGTAPAFIYETSGRAIISLPGVPREMEYLYAHSVLPYLLKRFDLHGIIKARVLHSAGVGESWVDEKIGDLETCPNPTVGLLAHAGQVDIRITAHAGSVEEADAMIESMARTIRDRLADAVYGEDEVSLEKIVADRLAHHGHPLVVVECGLGGELARRIQPQNGSHLLVQVASESCTQIELLEKIQQAGLQDGDKTVFGASLVRGQEKQQLFTALALAGNLAEEQYFYGGPPAMAAAWAANSALDFLRRNLK